MSGIIALTLRCESQQNSNSEIFGQQTKRCSDQSQSVAGRILTELLSLSAREIVYKLHAHRGNAGSVHWLIVRIG